MIRHSLIFLAALGALSSASATAQSQQDNLDARYERALAAGYKALMLCSAIANAESNGAQRSPESVMAWELAGIQEPFAALVGDLPYRIVRRPTGQIAHVAVSWADDMPARLAVYFGPESGCSALPIGAPESWGGADAPVARPAPVPSPKVVTKRPAPALADVAEGALSGDAYGTGTRTTAVLVQRQGAIAVERYAPGFSAATPQRTWSVAKSIAATLVGAAVLSGEVTVDDPVGLNYWRAAGDADPRNAITVDHALRMASGRYTDTPGNRTDPLYYGGSTVDETAVNWPLINRPGTTFRYANNDTLLAIKAIGRWLGHYPPHEFFNRLGMTHTVAETDMRGVPILSSQVWTTARDLARFGQLYIDDGVVNGERILPEGWVRYVSAPSGPQPDGPFGYGAGFWLMNRTDGVPADTIAAFGNRGQYVVIVPARKIVIVRRGEDPAGATFDIAAFARDVLAAIE